ncbi:MAG: prolyl oligopeptidase family serine peptidase [Melioribacteraceae bacterium]
MLKTYLILFLISMSFIITNCVPDIQKTDDIYLSYKSTQDTSLTLYANFFKPKKPSPIIVWMHGWHGRAKRRSADDVPPSLSKEWFLIQPDMRGRADSEGKQDCNGWELQDIVDAVEFAKKEYPNLISNPERICLIGGSGGGGNVLGLVGKFPDYFSAALAEFVISDYGMWYRADTLKKEFRDEMETKGWIGGSPSNNAEAYRSRGGLTTVENLLTPLAIIHGDRDIRVQVEQARAYVEKAKQVGTSNHINYLELPGVGAYIKGAHWENATKEQKQAKVQLTKNHFAKNLSPIEIPRSGKFIVTGYLKTKHFEVILESIDNIGEIIYNLDKDEYIVKSNSSKTAIIKIKKDGNWETKIITL